MTELSAEPPLVSQVSQMFLSEEFGDCSKLAVLLFHLVPVLDVGGAKQKEDDVSDDGNGGDEKEQTSPDILLSQEAWHDRRVSVGDKGAGDLAEQSGNSHQSTND